MQSHAFYMQRCLELAQQGAGRVAPNPLVGAVLVHNGEIIGEGAHLQYGGPHAEVNAIRLVSNPELLSRSTLYVNLEPCAHQGKTPPCTDLIISRQISDVVVGSLDTNPLVCGKGLLQLAEAGINVKAGILEAEARELNRRFFTWHEKKRPYIMLKWAQTADGFIDHSREEHGGLRAIVSSLESHVLAHQLRAQEAAILVGTATALLDDPHLTVRLAAGSHPVRLVTDRHDKLPASLRIFDGTVPAIRFSYTASERPYTDTVVIEQGKDELHQILQVLYARNLQSVLVEGGTTLLQAFLNADLWDEIAVFISPKQFGKGVAAPVAPGEPIATRQSGTDELRTYRNFNP
jgi:diaminohydroxyphosphoribosylaminopyrimidine deaminase/5-amino-6-(5-phosphoribosylamino)uracil reductase